jgi:hypothetical protein
MKDNEKADLEKTEDKYFCLLYPGINTILEKFGFPYKIVRPCPTKIVTYDGKERRADFFGQLDNNDIISLEAHSTARRKEDEEKFFDYACYMSTKYRRKVHTLVLSTHYNDNDELIFNWHNNDGFTIPYKSFKTLDGDKTINNISLKNKNNEELSKSEIGDLRILTFMKSKRSPKELLIKSIELTRHEKMNETDKLHTAVLQSFLAKKFVTDDEEYKEVMKMIEKSALDFEGILGRRDKIYYEEGIEEGKIRIKHQIAKNLIKEGLDDETIKRITKLNQKEYEKLKQQCSK